MMTHVTHNYNIFVHILKAATDEQLRFPFNKLARETFFMLRKMHSIENVKDVTGNAVGRKIPDEVKSFLDLRCYLIKKRDVLVQLPGSF